jgi:short-subunit dehydrogenase
LGVHIARALADRGADLALAARSAEELDAVRVDVTGRGVKAITVVTDVTDADARRRLVEQTVSELGGVEVLVNNAGIEANASYHDMDPATIESILTVNLTGAALLIREVLPHMVDAGRGHVVNVASLAGKSGTPFEAAYSASKFGLVGLTHALQAEYIDDPVNFSVVSPGFVEDDGMYARIADDRIHSPRMVGTTTPARVAAAVVQAVEKGRVDVIVNGLPMRPLLALSTAFPGLNAQLLKRIGVTGMLREAAEAERRRR